jgi:NAD(P)-dependent dehydrogenase (short-subunit alcohol dehydrogenase family)
LPQCHFLFHIISAFDSQKVKNMSNLARSWVIMTGVTRGIGSSIAKELRSRGYSICGVLRPNHNAQMRDSFDEVILHDLSQPFDSGALQQLSTFLKSHRVIGCVHAAGLLGPMTVQPPCDDFHAWQQWWKSYQDTFQVNLHSGIQLMSACQESMNEWSGVSGRRSPFVLHLSSGAALKPYAGWGAYCASKAALLMEFKCWAAKIAAEKCYILSVAPGTVMTDMMHQVLAANPDDFPALSKFKQLEKSGGLVEPELPARMICDWLLNVSHEEISRWHGELYDVRSSSSPTK